MKQKPHKNSL